MPEGYRPVLIEAFAFRRDGEVLGYRRTATTLRPRETPDAAVARLVGFDPAAEAHSAVLSHSTSWRAEPDGTIVLTYAVVPDPRPGEPAVPLHGAELATGEHPSRPAPAAVATDQVAAHAVRHLAFLRDTDPQARQVLDRDPAFAELLATVAPATMLTATTT